MFFNNAAACQINCDADHADFQFNSGTGVFTIDFWFRLNSLPSSHFGIYEQYIDDDNTISVYLLDNAGAYWVYFEVVSATTKIVSTWAEIPNCAVNTWYHCAIVRGYGGSANNIRVAIDGTFYAAGADDLTGVTLPDLAAAPILGFKQYGTDARFDGWLEEFRISEVARWITDFSPPDAPYFASNYVLIGTTRPADGVKFTVADGNGETAALSVSGWNGSSWVNVKDTDNTTGLASTGTLTFTSNITSSKPRYLNGQVLYWYYITLDTGTATVSRITADLPWQRIRNLYDGTLRKPLAFFHWDNSANSRC
jgi:hypothetical protein